MQIRKDYYTEARRSSTRLRRAVVASVAAHLLLLAGMAAVVHFLVAATPAISVLEVGFMAAGLPDAPEGVESTRDASKPPSPPEAPSVAPPVQEKKVEPPKPPEPKKVEKKPDPPKEEPEPKKVEKKAPPKEKETKKNPPKENKKDKPVTLPDANVNELLDQDMVVAQNEEPDVLAGGLPNATPSTRAQTGLGDPQSQEQGISVQGVPSVLGSWANQVRRAVKRYWQEPGAVPIGSSVAIVFTVSSGGQLLGEPAVRTPSNDATLDQSGINAIKLAAPFPPLPPGYNQTQQQVIFVFTISG